MAIVIKYGGNAMGEAETRRGVARAIRELATGGGEPIVVHGGGPFIEEELQRERITARFSGGLRVTPREALGPIERALTLLGKRLSQEIGEAVALTGRDSRLLLAETFEPELGRVGRMRGVNAPLLLRLLSAEITPVIACLAVDEAGDLLNVNADEVAGAVAGALGSPVVFLTNVAGVLADPGKPESRLARLDRSEVEHLIEQGVIEGGMIPKVKAALAALSQGATSAVIADGRRPEGLARALDATDGTTIVEE